MFYVYILKSKKVNRYYTGHSKDLAKRLQEHNSGKVRSTKYYALGKLFVQRVLELNRRHTKEK